MKKLFKKLLPFIIISLTTLILCTPVVSAKIISAERSVTVEKDQTIEDDLFIGGETVTIEGTVEGDLYAAGATVNIKGNIKGDAIVAGGTLNIKGQIGEDLRAAGGFINLNGAQINDNATLFGGDVSLDSETAIGGTVTAAAGRLNTQAQIGRNLLAGAGNIKIGGEVGKDAELSSENITIEESAQVKGNLKYLATSEKKLNLKGTVAGEIQHILPDDMPDLPEANWRRVFRRVSTGFKIVGYLSALAVGLLFIKLFPDAHANIVNKYHQKSWGCLGWGLVVLFLTPGVLILLAATVIGLPLTFILGSLYAISIYLSKIFTGSVLGQLTTDILNLNEKSMTRSLKLVVGLAVFFLLRLVPVLSFFIVTANVIFGLGATFSYAREKLFT